MSGELRWDLIACLRQRKDLQRPRSRAGDRRGQLEAMQSINLRPPQAHTCLIHNHWKANLVKGAFNCSAVRTLVERATRQIIRPSKIGGKFAAMRVVVSRWCKQKYSQEILFSSR